MEISSVKGIFLRYILMPLFAIIMMVILGIIRKINLQLRSNHYYIRSSVQFMSCDSGYFRVCRKFINPYWYLIAQIIYLILGIIHVNLSDRYFKKHFILPKSILFESILSLTCIGFGGYLFT
jgi:hypothetical protein